MGSEVPLTDEASTVTLITFSISGNSNIVLSRIFSRIDLNPLAPVFFSIAFLQFLLLHHLEILVVLLQTQTIFYIVL